MTVHSAPGLRYPGVHALEAAFGDPWDASKPLSYVRTLAADEGGEVLAAGESALDAHGLGAELVPVQYGGRLQRLDHLIQILRAACRRDPCLGFGYGMSSLMAGVNLWAAGNPQQCQSAADLLLANRRLGCAYHELDHGNDLGSVGLRATPGHDASHLLLNGRKHVIANIERAAALVLFARTSDQAGSRSHSQLFIDKAELKGGVAYLPRYETSGVRGVQLGGIEFLNCSISRQSVVGTPGQGIETALRSFQITRIALPAITVGVLDTALRLTVRYAQGRKLYGRSVADLLHPQAVMSNAFADLLLCDCVSTVAARSLHCLPQEASVFSAAVKLLVPQLLTDAAVALSAVIGAQFYLRTGEFGLMQKLVRDIQPLGIVHASKAACRASILAQLPLLAKRSWLSGMTAPALVFQCGEELPALPFDGLSLSARGQDHLTASLLNGCERVAHQTEAGTIQQELVSLCAFFREQLGSLTRACTALRPVETGIDASRRSYELVDRHAVIFAASCSLHVWLHQPATASAFMRQPTWIVAVLDRLATRLGRPRTPLIEELHAGLFQELRRRHDRVLTFDLAEAALGYGGDAKTHTPGAVSEEVARNLRALAHHAADT